MSKQSDAARKAYAEKCAAEGLPTKKELFLNLFAQTHLHKWILETEVPDKVEVDEKRYRDIALMWRQCDEIAWALQHSVCGPEPKDEE